MNFPRTTHTIMQRQRGAVFIVMLVFMIMGVAAFLVSSLNSSAVQIKRDAATADALAQAKEALIGYAAGVQISSSSLANQPRPGDLPCPDNHAIGSGLEGTSTTPCNVNALGRLPWKTLGLPDLRDSSGERLWYAVSTNFKNSLRIGTLNSDTLGTISIFSPNGTIVNDGSGTTGAVAVVIAPGDALTRQGGSLQDRSAAGSNIASNYLDIATIGGNTIDNASFIDSSATNGFIQGRVRDNNNNLIVNDILLVISQDNIMQAIQKRVVGEVRQCLIEYASLNNGRYPWAVPTTDLINYQDISNQLFGRLPADLSNTNSDSGGGIIMNDIWGPMCNAYNNNTPATWWLNWREMVFYGLANAYKPVNPPNPPAANSCTFAGACLTISPLSPTADKKIVVIASGKMLTGQVRTSNSDKSNLNNYLEGQNSVLSTTTFQQGTPSATFNDTVVFQ